MKRLLLFGFIGATSGLIAAVVANALMPSTMLGDLLSPDGRMDAAKLYAVPLYATIGYLILGSLLCAVVAPLVAKEKDQARAALVGFMLGGPLCAGANALVELSARGVSRLLSHDMLLDRAQSEIVHDLAFLLHYAFVPTALALGLTIAVGFNRFTIGRGVVSAGLGLVIGGLTVHLVFYGLLPFMVVSAMRHGPEGLSISAILKPLMIAHLFGMGLGAAVAFGVAQLVYKPAWLKVMNGWMEGRSLPIPAPIAMVGTRPDMTFPLPPDGLIAPVHAQIDSVEDQHLLRAIAEVRVNGNGVQEHWLQDNDLVEIGSFRFRYRNRLTPSSPPVVEPLKTPPAPSPVAVDLVLEDSMGGIHSLVQRTIIGRDQGLDVSLPWESTVSRRHASIERTPSGWLLTDLGSSNGTFLNGAPAASGVRLSEGDELRLGRCILRVKAASPAVAGRA